MELLSWKRAKKAENYMLQAAEIAKLATCERAKCWSMIIKNWKQIGAGYNSPAKHLESQRRCHIKKDSYDPKVTDKTCCIHAEQRAMFQALKNFPNEIRGSDLYFIRLDAKWEITRAGKPYCTICSKMALDLGIKHFILWHEEGIVVYNTEEYNTLSYEYCP